MKIPGLDEIQANMNKFADMLPVLESIDTNLRVLTETTILNSSNIGTQTRANLISKMNLIDKDNGK